MIRKQTPNQGRFSENHTYRPGWSQSPKKVTLQTSKLPREPGGGRRGGAFSIVNWYLLEKREDACLSALNTDDNNNEVMEKDKNERVRGREEKRLQPSREEEANFLTWCYFTLVTEKRKEEKGGMCQD